MDEQFDLAGAVAVILGFHIQVIRNMEKLGASMSKRLAPDLQAGRQVWIELKPLTVEGGPLVEQIHALIESPSAASRQALAERLRLVFSIERALQNRVADIVSHSPYASLAGAPSPEAVPLTPALQPNREIIHWLLVVVLGAAWGTSSLATTNRLILILPLIFACRAVCVGYLATRLRVVQGWWLALGGVLPGNGLTLLAALIGYRREEAAGVEPGVRYTQAMRILLTIPLAAPLLVAIGLTIASPSYMAQLFDFPVGLILLIVMLVLLAILVISVWLGFWKGKASTGIGISLAATAAAWCSLVVIYLLLLGPAAVRLTRDFPELLHGDFSIFRSLPGAN